MIKRELSKDEVLKGENWERFLPQFKPKKVKKKKSEEETTSNSSGKNKAVDMVVDGDKPLEKKAKKREYSPFPPPQKPSKIDLQLESGEYFLSKQKQKEKKRTEEAHNKYVSRQESKKTKKEQAFQPPKETAKAIKRSAVDRRSAGQIAQSILQQSSGSKRKREPAAADSQSPQHKKPRSK